MKLLGWSIWMYIKLSTDSAIIYRFPLLTGRLLCCDTRNIRNGLRTYGWRLPCFMRPVTYVTGYSPSQHDIVSAHLPPRDQCKTPVASCHVPLFFPWQLWNSYTIDKFSTKPQIAAKTALNSANLALWVKPCTDARVGFRGVPAAKSSVSFWKGYF